MRVVGAPEVFLTDLLFSAEPLEPLPDQPDPHYRTRWNITVNVGARSSPLPYILLNYSKKIIFIFQYCLVSINLNAYD